MTKSEGQFAFASPRSKFWETIPPSPMIYAHKITSTNVTRYSVHIACAQ